MQYIACDAQKHYTLASVERPEGGLVREGRISHERGALRRFLRRCDRGSPVAVETVWNWYWMVDQIEAAGCVPKLVHARKAKLMLGLVNKTDTLNARGLNRLQRTGTLPTVWIPPGVLRDQRDLPRTRMVLTRERTRLMNRIHPTPAKYAMTIRRRTCQTDTSASSFREGLHIGTKCPHLSSAHRFANSGWVSRFSPEPPGP